MDGRPPGVLPTGFAIPYSVLRREHTAQQPDNGATLVSNRRELVARQHWIDSEVVRMLVSDEPAATV